MDCRKNFKDIFSFDEFVTYYWYREELISICKELGICHTGEKADLYHYIEEYYKGNKIIIKAPSRKKVNLNMPLTKETSIIECGFCFNQHFRDFFIKETGNVNFKFNTDMVASVKKAKLNNDLSFTLGNLLAIYCGNEEYAKYDKSFCQWNQFLHDFCNDSFNEKYQNKLRAASIIWKELRESTEPKIYCREFVLKHLSLLNDLES